MSSNEYIKLCFRVIISFDNYSTSVADNYLRTNKQLINLFYNDLNFNVEVLSRTKPCLLKVIRNQYFGVIITFNIVTLADNYVQTNEQHNLSTLM